jgi:hypothetical protein
MILTKTKLKQLIKEEIAILFEQDEEYDEEEDESKYSSFTEVDWGDDEEEYDEEGNYIGPEPTFREEPLDGAIALLVDTEGDDTTGEDWDEWDDRDQDRSHAMPYTDEMSHIMTDADWADVGGREAAEQYFPNQPPAAVTRASVLPVTSSVTQSVVPVDTEYTASITDPEARRMYGSDILRTTPVEHTESFSYQK